MRITYFGHYPQWRRMVLVLMGVILTALFLYVQVPSIPAFSFARHKPIFEVQTEKKVLALTFDISWGTKTPAPVLDILLREKIKCTFFLSGPWALQHPDIPKRIASDGHEIATHGQRHVNYSSLSNEQIHEEISLARAALRDTIHREVTLIRTPNGDYNDRVIQTLEQEGLQPIQWGTDSLDWMNPGVDSITRRVLERAHSGDIILMHASDTCLQTVAALPTILKGLRDRGFEFVTVGQLLTMGRHVP